MAEFTAWRKSSFSEGGASSCVEVGFHPAGAAVRDSKNTEGPMLTLSTPAWQGFLAGLSGTVGGRP